MTRSLLIATLFAALAVAIVGGIGAPVKAPPQAVATAPAPTVAAGTRIEALHVLPTYTVVAAFPAPAEEPARVASTASGSGSGVAAPRARLGMPYYTFGRHVAPAAATE